MVYRECGPNLATITDILLVSGVGMGGGGGGAPGAGAPPPPYFWWSPQFFFLYQEVHSMFYARN